MNRRDFLQLKTPTPAVGSVAAQDLLEEHTDNPQSSGPSAFRALVTSTLAPWQPKAGEWNIHTAGHLLRRAGFGGSAAELHAALSISPTAAVDQLLDNKYTKDPYLPSAPAHASEWMNVPPYTYAGNPTQLQTDYYNASYALRRTWTVEMARPEVMLREKMIYFWMNHFVIEWQKVYYPHLIYRYLDYFRKNPWGNFKQMVKDVTIEGAMLVYLDGASNTGRNGNENYGRELMELFTLGVMDRDGNPNYTETDVKEVARALTGYTVNYYSTSTDPVLPATYDKSRHDNSLKQPFADAGAPKRPYGLASAGITDDVIDALFQYKADKVAWFIARKLYQYFVYHEIGETEKTIIDQLAETIKSSNWELKPAIAQLLKSEHFFDEANIGAAIKSPYELLIGLCRSLDITIDPLSAGTLWYHAYAMGQSLLDPPNVKGWPGYRDWVSTTTLPLRSFTELPVTAVSPVPVSLLRNGVVAALGATGYGEQHTEIRWGKAGAYDATVLSWAAQFSEYKGDINLFIEQLCEYMCAMVPSQEIQTSAIRGALQFMDYEWPGIPDQQRASHVRTILQKISGLPQFQLM